MSATALVLAVTALAAAVFGGAMFSFSTFVMPALREIAPRDGIVAMQAINRWAPKSLLMLPMAGVALGGIAVIVMALVGDGEVGWLRIVGALFALSSILITAVGNVPLNNKIDALQASAEAAGEWAAYAASWVRWNHLRTLTNIVGAVLLAMAAARI